MVTPTILRIAHAYGNRRARIEQALAAGVDMLEADLRWDGKRIWVRHEHRFGVLPLLYNNRLRGIHREGPFARPIGPYWFRLDTHRISFSELLSLTAGKSGLMLDLKWAHYRKGEAKRFIESVFETLEREKFPGEIAFCGGWGLCSLARKARADARVFFSVDGAHEWELAIARLRAITPPPGITIQSRLLTPERAAELSVPGVPFIAWDIETADEASAAIAAGARGLIADDLELLATLAGTPVHAGRAS